MKTDNITKAEVAMLATNAATHLRNYTVNSANFTLVNEQELFALGAQLLYVGQALTELSQFKLEPSSIEGKVIVSKIVELIEMKTINPVVIGQHITEPIEGGV
jgi:hypothetical protein